MPCTIGVVGTDAVGKKSFVLALGAKPTVGMTNTLHRRVDSTFLWSRPGGNGHKKTVVQILHSREKALDHDDDRVFVLLFDLTRRDSLAAVVAHWAHLSDVPGRRLLLVGTHADLTSKRQVSLAEIREFSGEFSAYEEVCCRSGHTSDEGMLRVQLTLTQWTSGGPRAVANDIPFARASICGGFPRPVVTMIMPAGTSYSLPASPAGQQCRRMQADIWIGDPTEKVASSPVATGVGGDVKLRTISKAIYDIRGAVAEKSKALAKYRDRQVSHWLTRSRYFGPTESSRHKRWQEEQKKRQQLTQSQSHHHHHHAGHWRRELITPDALQDRRGRSVSQPDTFGPPSRKVSARCGSTNSSSSGENEESPGTFLEHKSFLQPTDRIKHQRQRQIEEATLQVQKKRVAAKRALRKQRRAASNDMYERSSSPAVFESYLNCYDEMDMPPQLQPSPPSLDRQKPHSRPSSVSSVASSTSLKSFASREHNAFETDCVTLAGVQHSLDSLSPGAEPASRSSTSLPATHVQSPVSSIMSPPTPSSEPSSVLRHHSANNVLPTTPESNFLSDTALKVTTLDKPLVKSKSLVPSRAIAMTKQTVPAIAPPEKNSAVSRSNTMCSSGSENFDCNDIDDMLEYFEGMTLPI
ncbi:unnamed protein product [Peronospora farinosa]|uniref:Uncharacterized protein n=1 Tax=Peronospora farinosa TaxID=134698 RepID=A0AAV0T2D4_9STRA|nr:unnamed protein product [Peronospora farinosa]CAI5711041.1 unnamed protein product [Peronospora farinosa]